MGFTISGLNHLGLIVEDISLAKQWFVDFLGLSLVDDRGELLLLKAGEDILAVKTINAAINKPEHSEQGVMGKKRDGWQTLDHYGFYAKTPQEVNSFAEKLLLQTNAKIIKGPYDRSDGRSVYFKDPCGNVGEYFYYEPGFVVN